MAGRDYTITVEEGWYVVRNPKGRKIAKGSTRALAEDALEKVRGELDG